MTNTFHDNLVLFIKMNFFFAQFDFSLPWLLAPDLLGCVIICFFIGSVRCEQKTIKHAYHTVCTRCAQQAKVCEKCGQAQEIVAK